MAGTSKKLLGVKRPPGQKLRGFCVGHIFRITPEGKALVDYPSNPMGIVEARSAMGGPRKGDDDCYEGIPVLLLFENGDPSLPIIVGIIHDTLYPTAPNDDTIVSLERPRNIVVNGKKRFIDAEEEIMLRCGKSSVILRKDGKIVIKGAQILSRASETQKIKGASVRIN
jgi:hypothetical protein